MRGKLRIGTLLATVVVGMVLLLCSCDGEAVATLSPTDRFFVNDFADVISTEDENNIYALGVRLFEKTTAQVVAVTVPSLDGKDIEQYSLELARDWGIGNKEKNNGMLLLLAVEDREVRIEVGYGLEGAVTDAQSGILLDHYAVPAFSENDFSSGMVSTYRALVNEVYLEYGLQPEDGYVPVERLPDNNYDGELSPLATLGVVIFVIIFVLLFRNKPWFPWLFFFGGGGGHHRGGGYHGGGGGFGGFSGGGGSFGGGGASRKF